MEAALLASYETLYNDEFKKLDKVTNLESLGNDILKDSFNATNTDILGLSKQLNLVCKRAGLDTVSINRESINEDPYLQLSICQEGIKDFFIAIGDTIKKIWDKIVEIFKSIFNWFKNLFTSGKRKRDLEDAIEKAEKLSNEEEKEADERLITIYNDSLPDEGGIEAIQLDTKAVFKQGLISDILDFNKRIASKLENVVNEEAISSTSAMVESIIAQHLKPEARALFGRNIDIHSSKVNVNNLMLEMARRGTPFPKPITQKDIYITKLKHYLPNQIDVLGVYISPDPDTIKVDFELKNVSANYILNGWNNKKAKFAKLKAAAAQILKDYNIQITLSKDFQNQVNKINNYVNKDHVFTLDRRNAVIKKLVDDNMKTVFKYIQAVVSYLIAYDKNAKAIVQLIDRTIGVGSNSYKTGVTLEKDLRNKPETYTDFDPII